MLEGCNSDSKLAVYLPFLIVYAVLSSKIESFLVYLLTKDKVFEL